MRLEIEAALTRGVRVIPVLVDDDAGFRRWREDNPDGFFLNTERNPGPVT